MVRRSRERFLALPARIPTRQVWLGEPRGTIVLSFPWVLAQGRPSERQSEWHDCVIAYLPDRNPQSYPVPQDEIC